MHESDPAPETRHTRHTRSAGTTLHLGAVLVLAAGLVGCGASKEFVRSEVTDLASEVEKLDNRLGAVEAVNRETRALAQENLEGCPGAGPCGQADDGAPADQGFTDAAGEPSYNEWLSDRRAHEVSRYLATKLQSSRLYPMTSVGLGESHPVADNDVPTGRSMNRRVEVHVLVPSRAEMATTQR